MMWGEFPPAIVIFECELRVKMTCTYIILSGQFYDLKSEFNIFKCF